MVRGLWIDVIEGQSFVVLIDNFRRSDAGSNPAEDTSGDKFTFTAFLDFYFLTGFRFNYVRI